jgi:hypothetical protein
MAWAERLQVLGQVEFQAELQVLVGQVEWLQVLLGVRA